MYPSIESKNYQMETKNKFNKGLKKTILFYKKHLFDLKINEKFKKNFSIKNFLIKNFFIFKNDFKYVLNYLNKGKKN